MQTSSHHCEQQQRRRRRNHHQQQLMLTLQRIVATSLQLTSCRLPATAQLRFTCLANRKLLCSTRRKKTYYDVTVDRISAASQAN